MSLSPALPKESANLITLLKDQDPAARERAAYALGRSSRETEDILLALGEALFDTDDEVCIAAAVALFGFGIGSKPALPLLMKALQHRNVTVRCLAVATLAGIGPDARDALPVIIKQTESPDSRERYWAAQAQESIEQDSE